MLVPACIPAVVIAMLQSIIDIENHALTEWSLQAFGICLIVCCPLLVASLLLLTFSVLSCLIFGFYVGVLCIANEPEVSQRVKSVLYII